MNDDGLSPAESAALALEEAEPLIWSLLDDHLDETGATKLNRLLEQHEIVRRRYVECVQLHIDLQEHFASARAASAAGTPILPNLTPGVLPSADVPITD